MDHSQFSLSNDPSCFLEEETRALIFSPHPGQLLLALLLHSGKTQGSSFQIVPVLCLLPQKHRTRDHPLGLPLTRSPACLPPERKASRYSCKLSIHGRGVKATGLSPFRKHLSCLPRKKLWMLKKKLFTTGMLLLLSRSSCV